MNKRFKDYLETLTPKKRLLAQEAVAQYLTGEGQKYEKADNPTAVYNICRDLSLEEIEKAVVLLTRRDHTVIKRVEINSGGLSETFFDVRLILREALLNNAVCVTMVHNHPSGCTEPSRQDDHLTDAAKKACDIMRIHLTDHVIIGNGSYYSYRENGKL